MKYFVFLFLFIAVALPQYTLAVVDQIPPEKIVTCDNGGACNYCDLTNTINNATRWTTFIALLIGVILFIYAGYRISSARGDVGIVTEARKMMGNVAIGVFILLLALSIVDIIVKTTTGDSYGVWTKVKDCGSQEGAGAPPPKYKSEKMKTGQGITVLEDNNGFGNDPQGEYGAGTSNTNNNGSGNDPQGEYGAGTNSGQGSVYVTPISGPQ